MAKILMSNLGYLRGIDGCLSHHFRYAYRHLYCPRQVQEACLAQVIDIIEREEPDLCCFVEIDKDITNLDNYRHFGKIINDRYPFLDIENKYGPNSRLRKLYLTRSKSNGFLSSKPIPFEKIYFEHGTKRLIYKLSIKPDVTVFFAHFSLKKAVRALQLIEIRQLLARVSGEVILLGDFNIHSGFAELAPLLHENNLVLLNQENIPTFRFHNIALPLDLCICSKEIANTGQLRIIPQPYSDHEALLLTLNGIVF